MSQSISPVTHASGVHYDTDRRNEQRSATQAQAILRFQDRLQAIQGTVCDISVGGAGFICRQPVANSSKCTLQFELPSPHHGAPHAATVPVIVVNSMQVVGQIDQFRINLRFAGLPSNVRGHIEGFIRQSLSHKSAL